MHLRLLPFPLHLVILYLYTNVHVHVQRCTSPFSLSRSVSYYGRKSSRQREQESHRDGDAQRGSEQWKANVPRGDARGHHARVSTTKRGPKQSGGVVGDRTRATCVTGKNNHTYITTTSFYLKRGQGREPFHAIRLSPSLYHTRLQRPRARHIGTRNPSGWGCPKWEPATEGECPCWASARVSLTGVDNQTGPKPKQRHCQGSNLGHRIPHVSDDPEHGAQDEMLTLRGRNGQ